MARPMQTLAVLHGALWTADPWYKRSWFIWPQAASLVLAAWLIFGGAGYHTPGKSPWAPVQQSQNAWSLARSASGIVLSGDDLVATAPSSPSFYYYNSFSVVQRSDKRAFQITVRNDVKPGGENVGVGIANAKASVSGPPVNGARYIGIDTNGIALYDDGTVWLNGKKTVTSLTFATGDFVSICVDVPSRLIWFQVNGKGPWNGNERADPAAAKGGISFSQLGGGGIFAALSLVNTSSVKANFTSLAALPSGFKPWGAK